MAKLKMKKNDGLKILILTFIIFFAAAWVALIVEQKYFPSDPTVYCDC